MESIKTLQEQLYYVIQGKRYDTIGEVVNHYNSDRSCLGIAIIVYNTKTVGSIDVDRLSAECRRLTK